jgi:hypothetical protein
VHKSRISTCRPGAGACDKGMLARTCGEGGANEKPSDLAAERA